MNDIDESRLKGQMRACLRDRAGFGGCPFYEELGSCYECSWPHSLAFVIGEEAYAAWRAEIMAELQPEIDTLPLLLGWQVLTTLSVDMVQGEVRAGTDDVISWHITR